MKKFIKVFLIVAGSLILLSGAAVSIVLWFIFTPEKLTPIVREQAGKYLTCPFEIDHVELTFFSTFPEFQFKINTLRLINPVTGAPSDTLLNVNQLNCAVDINALWKKKEVVINHIILSDGHIHLYTDSIGHNNYTVFSTSHSSTSDTAFAFGLDAIKMNGAKLNNIHLHFLDHSSKIETTIADLTATIKGSLQGQGINLYTATQPFDLSFCYNNEQDVEIKNLVLDVNAAMIADSIYASINTQPFYTSWKFHNEPYLQHTETEIHLQSSILLNRQMIKMDNLALSLHTLALQLKGTVGYDAGNSMLADLSYRLDAPLKEIIPLIPAVFSSYIQGMNIEGNISSDGKIQGIYNDTVFPVADIRFRFEKGAFGCKELPIPLSDIDGDFHIYTDFKDDALSFLEINHFIAKTPKSFVQISGSVNHFFSDIHAQLQTKTVLNLSELNRMFPTDMKMDMQGKATGNITSDFTLSQLEKVELDKIKLAGSLLLSDMKVIYDSLSLTTDRSHVHFSLPNRKSTIKGATFLSTQITSDNLTASTIDGMNAHAKNADISVEISDIRDTTHIPSLLCSFRFDHLKASLDTIHVAISTPQGNASIIPVQRKTELPKLHFTYNGGNFLAIIGKDSIKTEKIDLKTDVVYNKTQEDILLKYMPKGFIDIDNGYATLSSLQYPIAAPDIKMAFTPREFTIDKANIRIGNSDFQLNGQLSNILSHFRRDSLLRGSFKFSSTLTDITQLMQITNANDDKNTKELSNTSNTGPYMIPKGVDILLHTDITKATYGKGLFNNIKGNVRVHNGILVLDELKFTTPAADMQVTAMYQTPRKNHLYMGVNLHMFRVEINELLEMIPAIDTMMPMLRSFGGKGEFHVAAETNLDSLYNFKISTLKAAASIRGEDLVLMDGETFSEIAKSLRFSKKTENKVDSLSAEFTIFKNEVDVYPFLIVMDKYKAVIGGQHNLDMSFLYNISIVESPLPFRLSLNVSGTLDNLKYRLAKNQYPDFYRPVSRKVVENQQAELRNMIRNSLIKNTGR